MTSAGGDEISWAELHYSRLTSKPARDAIRQAIASAKHGPVWLVNRDGRRTGAIVTEEDAAFLREIRRGLHEAGTGQTVDLGSFAEQALSDDEGPGSCPQAGSGRGRSLCLGDEHRQRDRRTKRDVPRHREQGSAGW